MAIDSKENTENNKVKIDSRMDSPPGTYGAAYTPQNDLRLSRLSVISTADDEVNITEPSSPQHSQYPYNTVRQSLSGHVQEFDDTPGSERILEQHKSGTFYEIHPDGTRVLRVYGDNFEISLQDNNLVVGGNLNITVQGNANILTKGDVKQKIGGNYDLTVHGNMTTRVRGDRLEYTKGQLDIQSFSDIKIRSEGKTDIHSKGNMNVQTAGTYTLDSQSAMVIYAGNNLQLSTQGSFKVKASGQMGIRTDATLYLDGTQIRLNNPGPAIPIINPETNDPKDKDPTGGLTIEDSVSDPSIENILFGKTDNSSILALTKTDIKKPKDRILID
jgi:hypothetical protein